MAFKFVTFAALVAVARAGLIAQPAVSYAAAPALLSAPVAKVAYATAPIAKVAYAAQPEEYDANPQYSFSPTTTTTSGGVAAGGYTPGPSPKASEPPPGFLLLPSLFVARLQMVAAALRLLRRGEENIGRQ
uniref:Uncharacterized protein n=1 Tax=Anopheles atroparvus TaxID=41427 RepID=A0A182IN18_ANOAO